MKPQQYESLNQTGTMTILVSVPIGLGRSHTSLIDPHPEGTSKLWSSLDDKL